MKHKLYRTLILLFISFICIQCARNYNDREVQRLIGFCKVWGFLKYYHPNVGSDDIDWDRVLLETISRLSNQNLSEYHKTILDLIDIAGAISECRACVNTNSDKLIKLVDFSWFEDEVFNRDIANKLQYILENKEPYENFYVKPSNLRDSDFSNEKSYSELENLDVNYRILGLFRYWNAMEYFYPYKNLTDNDWDQVLEAYIPKFVQSQDSYQYYLNIRSLAGQLNDGHSWVSHAKFDKKYIGKYPTTAFRVIKIDDQFIMRAFVSDSLAKLDGIEIGDRITHIDGQPILAAFEAERQYTTTQSNIAEIQKGVFQNLFSGDTRNLNLTLIRDGKEYSVDAIRYEYSEVFHKNRTPFPNTHTAFWERLNDQVTYVNMKKISSDKKVQELVDNVFDSENLILDIRNYPPFMPFFTFISHLFDKEYPQLHVYSLPYFVSPGFFRQVGSQNELHTEVLLPNQTHVFKGNIILLVDSNTKSRSEFFASILQLFPRVTTIGSQTAGSCGNARSLLLPGNISTQYTAMGAFYNDGGQMQRKGVKIDFEVYPTIKGIKSGRDQYVEKALELLNKN